jgi:hypothetical protein
MLGIFLPLLPATPFLLLASACYLKSSERLHWWLMNNKALGGYIKGIIHRRGIPLRAKVVAIIMLWASLLFSIYRIEHRLLEVMLIVIGITSSIFILRMKTLRESE